MATIMAETGQSRWEQQIPDITETILEYVNDGIYITDNEANTIYANHRYELVSGLRRSDVIGRNMREMVESGVISDSGTLAVLESGKSVTMSQTFNTGRQAVISSSPVYAGEGDGKYLLMVITVVDEVTEMNSLRRETKRLQEINRMYVNRVKKLQEQLSGTVHIIAEDKNSKKVLEMADRAALVDDPILITGEKGVGKEYIARYIHRNSEREQYPFINIDFSSIPQSHIMGYLFGETDPETREYRSGILENASGGTVYLREITDMPTIAYSSFLALFRHQSCRMGDGIYRSLNIHFIAGSSHTIKELRQGRQVGEEMLDMLTVIHIPILPLRERRDDILPLADCFLKEYNSQSGEHKYLSGSCRRRMREYSWPENIEELRIRVRRASILNADSEIQESDIFSGTGSEAGAQSSSSPADIASCSPKKPFDLKMELYRTEASYMTEAFRKYGSASLAAKCLNMDSSTFVRKRQKYVKLGLMSKNE